MMNLRDFFELLYKTRPDNSHLLIWKPKDNRSFWMPDIEEAVNFIRSQPKEDLYFQVGLAGKKHGKRQRCSLNEDDKRPVVALPAAFADIDIAHPCHKKKNLPPSLEEALSIVEGHGFDPTITIHSGHGIQCYWVFKEMWETDTPEERKKAMVFLRRFKACIQGRAAEKGYAVDSVQDLVRILRLPETWNCKNGNKVQVKVLKYEDFFYNPEDLEEFLPDDPGEHTSTVTDNQAISTHTCGSKEIRECMNTFELRPSADPPDDKFHALCEIEPLFLLSWKNKRDDLPDKSASGYDQSLANYAVQAGWTNQELADLFMAHRQNHGHDLHLKNKQKYARTILTARARTKDKPNIPSIIAQLKNTGDASLVYDHVEDFAKLSKAELSKIQVELKNIFGKDLNLNDFKSAIKEAQRANAKKNIAKQNPDLPHILINNKQLRDITKESLDALKAKNDPPETFVRTGDLVRILTNEDGKPFIGCHNESSIRHTLSLSANFFSENDRGVKAVTPPKEVSQSILSQGMWPFPALKGITEIPTLRKDGSILEQPGYDSQTKLYYKPVKGLNIPPIPDKPTQEVAQKSLQYIQDELMHDFPFVDEASKANALGALLSPITRPMIKGSIPLAVVDATINGTSKSLFCDCVSVIATGREGAMLNAPDSDREFEKVLVSTLMDGDSLIIFDNVETRLSSASLARAITSKIFSGRLLRTNTKVDLPVETTFICTGNNIRLGGDIPRRCYWIRMDPKTSRPWLRANFRHPKLLEWVHENRGKLVANLLIMARAWIIAGKPDGKAPKIGSFEDWCYTIGGILKYAGVNSFLGNIKSMYDRSDEESLEWEAFLSKWYEWYGEEPQLVSNLYIALKMENSDILSGLRETLPGDLLASLEGKTKSSFARGFGIALKKMEGRRFGEEEFCLEKSQVKDTRSGAVMWKVTKYREKSKFTAKGNRQGVDNVLKYQKSA